MVDVVCGAPGVLGRRCAGGNGGVAEGSGEDGGGCVGVGGGD